MTAHDTSHTAVAGLSFSSSVTTPPVSTLPCPGRVPKPLDAAMLKSICVWLPSVS